MSAFLASLIAQFWPYILAGVGGLALILQQRRAGAKAERDKQARRDKAALEDRLEMHREATEQEKRAAGMSEDELDRLITKR